MTAQVECIPTVPPNEKLEHTNQSVYQDVELNGSGKEKMHNGGMKNCPSRPMLRRKVKRKEEGPFEIVCGWIVQHQIGLAVNLLTLLFLTHLCFPRARRHTRKFFELSYFNPESGHYCAGWNDAFMVLYWIVMFTGLRAAVMDYILSPLARWAGIEVPRNQIRFAEQAWLLVFYSVFWPLGMYILLQYNYWRDLRELWTNWPNREVDGLRKFYILVQFAFWLQQMMVINMEKRRKDHWQMFTHHIVTSALIFASYGYHQTKVANLILCTMDVVDLFLPAAKCLKYLGYETLPDVFFGIFMFTWVMARHIYYIAICYSVWADIPSVINYGCYRGRNGAIVGPFPAPDRFSHFLEPFRDPEGVVCWNNIVKWGFLYPLLFLQGITIVWFSMILKVALKVLQGGQADDVRSDDESSEVEEFIEEEDEPLPPQYVEEEVGVEAINLKGWANRFRKGTSSSSGVSIAGRGDRKELLGRIGCDKGTTRDGPTDL